LCTLKINMKIYYISPATIPSRSANSIHVVNMCEGLSQLGYDVTLFARSESLSSSACKDVLCDYYGIDAKRIEVVAYRNRIGRGAELFIGLYAFFKFIKDTLRSNAPGFIISRNLYGAVLLGLLFRKRVVYESHAPDVGLRKYLQSWLIKSKKISSVVISDALRKVIASKYRIPEKTLHVMHDAARSGQEPMSHDEQQMARNMIFTDNHDLISYKKVVGYFGHLYPGRGIEIIQGMAAKNPDIAFIVYGGNEREIKNYTDDNSSENLYFMGYLQPKNVHKAMAMMDVLLMPYQKSVSIGLGDIDTAQWMSPMKLFEYMSVGVPIISSDLPVLREVLSDGENCLLVGSNDIHAWSRALRSLTPHLATKISSNAYKQYLGNHTWVSRSQKMLELLEG
jgi:glycosyltransferase involved in cell wall biosynthesis